MPTRDLSRTHKATTKKECACSIPEKPLVGLASPLFPYLFPVFTILYGKIDHVVSGLVIDKIDHVVSSQVFHKQIVFAGNLLVEHLTSCAIYIYIYIYNTYDVIPLMW